MNKTLVILAAGMGSRYGGLKQIDGVGSHNEPIIEFTIYDAIKTGFNKIVLIIRKEHQEVFEENLVSKIRKYVDVQYAYQDLKNVPEGIEIPQGREKPWGTTHALLATKGIIKDEPFIVCNADDYYGRDAFIKVSDFFENNKDANTYCMVGYKVENTLSLNGTVTRGVCQKDDNGLLTSIKEVMAISFNESKDEVIYTENDKTYPLALGTPVSMNFWGLKPSVLANLEEIFKKEIKQGIENNPLKYEQLLPNDMGKLVKENECQVRVLTSLDKWFGVTYKQDKENVVNKFKELKANGTYPDQLF